MQARFLMSPEKTPHFKTSRYSRCISREMNSRISIFLNLNLRQELRNKKLCVQSSTWIRINRNPLKQQRTRLMAPKSNLN